MPRELTWDEGFRDLDLRAVRCLVVLGEEHHFQHAALRLRMSQPGLSRAITALERRVGADLVVRSSRPVRLTAPGEVLATHGRRLLAAQQVAFESLAASVRDDDGDGEELMERAG
jgi:DNA-binding transcriptional LysR family regulator